MKPSINIVVMGKSGAGKSSFCNYLFGLPEHFAAGRGKPVTGWEKNFQSESFDKDAFTIRLHDTVGIEPDNFNEWKERFHAEIAQRDRSDEPAEWVHGYFYVFNASSARIEDLEIQLLDLLSEFDAPVQVILTNCDVAGEEKTRGMYKVLTERFPSLKVHQVCSVAIRKRGGVSSAAYGRDEVLQDYLNQSEDFLMRRLAVRSCDKISALISSARDQLIQRIEQSKLSVLNFEEYDFDGVFDIPDLHSQFDDLNVFKNFLAEFGFPNDRWDQLQEQLMHAVRARVEAMMGETSSHFDQLTNQLEHGTAWEKVCAGAQMANTVIFLKSTVAEILRKGFNSALDEVATVRAAHRREPRRELLAGATVAVTWGPLGWLYSRKTSH